MLGFLVCVVKRPAGSAGGVQIGLLGLQFLVAIASAYAGIRLVDDIRYIKGILSRRESRD